eukprot:scaffold5181_cov125-Isochrysis_galbana.AAC.5
MMMSSGQLSLSNPDDNALLPSSGARGGCGGGEGGGWGAVRRVVTAGQSQSHPLVTPTPHTQHAVGASWGQDRPGLVAAMMSSPSLPATRRLRDAEAPSSSKPSAGAPTHERIAKPGDAPSESGSRGLEQTTPPNGPSQRLNGDDNGAYVLDTVTVASPTTLASSTDCGAQASSA